jgi:hypothetical protein
LQQRSGRTGRHRPGRVVHLLLEGKEVEKYNSNKNAKAQVAVRFVADIHLQCKFGLPCSEHSKGAVVHVAVPCANNHTCGMQAQHTMHHGSMDGTKGLGYGTLREQHTCATLLQYKMHGMLPCESSLLVLVMPLSVLPSL